MNRLLVAIVAAAVAAGSAWGAGFRKSDVAASAKWAAHVDMEKLAKSRVGTLLQDGTNYADVAKGLAVLQQVIGVNPLKDIGSVTLYGPDYEENTGVAVVRGTLNAQKVLTLITASRGYEAIPAGADTLHKWINEKGKTSVLCFLGADTAVMGNDADSVRAAVEVLQGKRASLNDLQKGAPSLRLPDVADSTVLFASAESAGGRIGQRARAGVVQNMEWLTLTLAESAGNLDLALRIGASSAENAQQIEQVVRGMVAFAALTRDSNSALADLAKGATVSVEQGVVSVRFRCSVDALNAFIQAQKALKDKAVPSAGAVPDAGQNAVP